MATHRKKTAKRERERNDTVTDKFYIPAPRYGKRRENERNDIAIDKLYPNLQHQDIYSIQLK